MRQFDLPQIIVLQGGKAVSFGSVFTRMTGRARRSTPRASALDRRRIVTFRRRRAANAAARAILLIAVILQIFCRTLFNFCAGGVGRSAIGASGITKHLHNDVICR